MPQEVKQNKSQYGVIDALGVNFFAGLVTGTFSAGAFNPWDRALYLSVKHRTPFLKELFSGNPYHGFSQAVVQRIFSGMVYFAAASQIRTMAEDAKLFKSENSLNFFVGTTAGAFNGFILNQMSVVKYYTWGKEDRRFLASTLHIINRGGFKVLFKGVNATITRDIVFGIVYEVARSSFRKMGSNEKSESIVLVSNLSAAALATVASGPFNFARNIKYATPVSKKPPSTFHCIYNMLFLESLKTDKPLSYLQERMRIGWGTARVAVAMATSQWLFDFVKHWMESKLYDK